MVLHGRYPQDRTEYFDIHNFVELGSRIQSSAKRTGLAAPLKLNTNANMPLYLCAKGFPEPKVLSGVADLSQTTFKEIAS
jgi:hypothetical protein